MRRLGGAWGVTVRWLLGAIGLMPGGFPGAGGAELAGAGEGSGRDRGREAVVIYNTAMPESLSVAQHYAERRGVPTNRLVGLSLPVGEVISRADFEFRLQRPLVAELTGRGLMTVREEIRPATEDRPGRVAQVVTDSEVRYLVLCHGVPLRVAEDASRREPESASLPDGLRRNEAAVDAELTVLPLLLSGYPLTGPVPNPLYNGTNAALLTPKVGFFVVGRLDGPNAALAAGLVDRALEAEQNGLLGRGYFDLRMATDPGFVPGDRSISNSWAVAKSYGFDTYLDQKAATLPTGFPMSHVALYAGWYSAHVTGPFALPQVEFMPGAIAYHLHSFSATTVRSTNSGWVGPLVARGVTATMGTVSEPYLDGTPDMAVALSRLMYFGFTWGEAAIVAQRLLSWQLTVVGDPLYRPFPMNALDRAKDLASRQQGRVDWAIVQLYNRKREVAGGGLKQVIQDLEAEPRMRFSSILQEKLADFHREAGHSRRAGELYRSAALLMASAQQKKRLAWEAAEALEASGDDREAYTTYRSLVAQEHSVADPVLMYERLRQLATKLGEDGDATRWAHDLERLRSQGR